MKQWLYATMLIYVLFWFQPYNVQASPEETADQEVTANEMMNQNLDQVNLDELKMFWDDIMNKYSEFLPAAQKGSLMEFIKGEKEFSFSGWLAGFGKYIFHELLQNGKLLGMLILLTVFSLFLQSMQNAFEKSSISKVAYSIVFMVLTIIALNSFHLVIQYTKETIDLMISFFLALVPLLLALIAASGGIVSAAFFQRNYFISSGFAFRKRIIKGILIKPATTSAVGCAN